MADDDANPEDPARPRSPCVRICQIDDSLGHCLGCGRTRAEIWQWTRCSDARKAEILVLAARRRAGT